MGYVFQGLALNIVQALLLLAFAPLIAGIINKVKAFLQKRQGASVLQEYLIWPNGGRSLLFSHRIPALFL